MWQIISTYIGIVSMMIGVIGFGIIVINESLKVSKHKLITILLLICIIHTILYLNLQGTIKTLIMCTVNVILYSWIFKISYKKSALLTVLYMIILILPDLLELFFITKILKLSMEACYNNYAGSILSNFIVSILLIIITYLLKKYLRKLIKTEIDKNNQIILFSILTFICTLMFFYNIINDFRFGKNIIVYVFAIIILLIVL